MQVSENCLRIISEFEQGPKGGFAATPYLCSAGKRTIGWGHVILPGERFTVISAQEADIILRRDLARFERCVSRNILPSATPTTQDQFDAMVSLAFNIGEANFSNSSMLKLHVTGQRTPVEASGEDLQVMSKAQRVPRTAPDQFLAWCFVNKKWMRGLWRRRWLERQLYLSRR